jgi:hypothetical protein
MPLTLPYSKAETRERKSVPESRIEIDPQAANDREAVARLAYALWQEHGCPAGTDVEDWLQAERELSQQQAALAP